MDPKKIKMAEIKDLIGNWNKEMNSSAIYQTMAKYEKDGKISQIYRRMSGADLKDAQHWADKIKTYGLKVPEFRPAWRTRIIGFLVKTIGVDAVFPIFVNVSGKADSRHSRYQMFRAIRQVHTGGMEGGILARLEVRHRTGGNALRAAVLGASDGLLSNFNLIMGVTGAQFSNRTILLTGIAGLLAGSISMALGEWISVQSSRELYKKQIQIEKEEIESEPEEETEELVLIYQARGLNESAARSLAEKIMSNKEGALITHAREELGIDPEQLGGSAWVAAISSFMLFATGAILPLFPFIIFGDTTAIVLSAVLSASGFFLIGSSISLFTGRPALLSGLRQVVFGLVAASITYLIGHLLGVGIS